MPKALSWYLIAFLILLLSLLHFVVPLPPSWYPLKLFLIFVISIFIIIKSSDYMVFSITDYAQKTRLPHFLVGFTIISIIITFPDLFTGLFASFSNEGDLILGDVFNAVMIDLALLIGLTALIVKKIKLKKAFGKEIWLILALAFLPLLFSFDSQFSRLEGFILFLSLILYLLFVTIHEVRTAHVVKEIAFKKIWQDIFIFGFTFGTVLLGAMGVVFSATRLAKLFHIPSFLVGLFVIGLCNSLQDILFQVKAARQGNVDVGLGNSIGSILINIFMVFGLTALIRPFSFTLKNFLFSYIYILLIILFVFFLLKKRHFTWKAGLLLVFLYLLFLVLNLFV